MRIVDLLMGIIIEPSSTMKKVTARRPVGVALIISLSVLFLQNLTYWALQRVEPFFSSYFVSEHYLLEILLTVIFLLLGVLFMISVFQVVAKLFGATWNFWGLFSGICFAQFIFIFFPLISLAGFLTDPAIFLLLNLLLVIWYNILAILAIKESLSLSIGQAVATYFLSILALIILFFILVLVGFVIVTLFSIAFV